MSANRAGDDSIHQPFRNLAAIGQTDRRIGHQMANIAHKHQAAAGQAFGCAIAVCIGLILGKLAG